MAKTKSELSAVALGLLFIFFAIFLEIQSRFLFSYYLIFLDWNAWIGSYVGAFIFFLISYALSVTIADKVG